MITCITLKGRIEDGSKMRPRYDWAAMLVDQYASLPVSRVIEEDGTHTVTIQKELVHAAPWAFAHLMEFARLHKLQFTINYDQCTDCASHHSCLINGG